MVRDRRSLLWLAAAPVVTIGLILASPLRVSGGDTLPGSVGGMSLHCSAVTRLETIDVIGRLAQRETPLPYWMVRDADGAVVSTWGPGPQVLSSFGFIGVGSGETLTAADLRARSRRVAAVWLALGIGILGTWLARRRGAASARTAGAALVVAVSYAAAPTLGEAVWQATVAVVPLLLGFVIAVRPEGRLRLLGPAALLLAAFLRPPIFLLALGLGVQWLLVRPRWSIRQLAIATAAAIGMVALLCAWNASHWGTIFPMGQWRASSGESAQLLHYGPVSLARGIVGLLASPGRGLLWFAPLAIVGAIVAWKQRLRAVALACAAQLVFVAGWYDWWGGAAFGPRLLGEVSLVLCAIALAFYADCGPWLRRAVVVTAAWTCIVGVLGIFRWDPSQWEARHPKTELALWNVVDSPIPAMARDPLPMQDWLDTYQYRCTDVGVETVRLGNTGH